MTKIRLIDYLTGLPDNDSCLEWLKGQIFPEGIKCRVCKRITRHHKLSGRPCYICDNCGHHVYPAAGTLFRKSSTPLKTWFEIIKKQFDSKGELTITEIQKEYQFSYKTALRITGKVREFLLLNRRKLAATVESNPAGFNNTLDFRDRNTLASSDITTTESVDKDLVRDSSVNPVLDHLSVGTSPGPSLRDYDRKRDRTARLLRIQIILWQHSNGLEIARIAETCGVSERTIYRDLETLESVLEVPIWAEGNKRGITPGYFLPPVIFNKTEAMNIFLAVRLMQNFSRLYNPSMVSTFIKLSTIVRPRLRKQIQNTLEYIDKLPRNDIKIENFNKLAEAWLSHHKAKIQYRELAGGNIETYIIEPYFIEPAMPSRSSYVIAYCPLKDSLYTFKIDLIVGEIVIEPDTYEIPSSFNAIDYLGSSWGIFTDEKLETVKLLFNQRISKGIMETVWHPSQKVELQKDESLIMTLKVRNTIDFRAWIMGWGNNIKVLEPATLRHQIKAMAESIVNNYS